MRVTNRYKIQLIFYLSIITISLGASILFFLTVIRPVFIERLQIYGQKTATRTVNTAIADMFANNKTDYSQFVSLDKSPDGSISALITNTTEMNRLRAEISKELESELNKLDWAYINIPAGSILANELFAGLGPDIKIKIRPMGLVEIDFRENFESCGINQSRHTIYIIASVDVSVVSYHSRTACKVSTKIPVCETVIVGDVPKYLGQDSNIKTTLIE